MVSGLWSNSEWSLFNIQSFEVGLRDTARVSDLKVSLLI